MTILFYLIVTIIGAVVFTLFLIAAELENQRAFERQIRAHELLRASLNSFQQRVPKPRRQTTTAKGKSKL